MTKVPTDRPTDRASVRRPLGTTKDTPISGEAVFEHTPTRMRGVQRRRPRGNTRCLQIRIENEVADTLDSMAEAQNLSLSGFLANLLREHLRQRRSTAR
jgi:hypothetical protein